MSAPPLPQYCPPLEDLDLLELHRVRALRHAPELDVPDAVARAASESGGLEVTDPEGVPVARYQVGQDQGRLTLTTSPEWLGTPSPRPYERLYRTPAQVNAAAPEGGVLVVVDRRMRRRDVADVRRGAAGRPVTLLALTGPSMSPYTSGVKVLRSCLLAADALPDARVVAVPLSRAQAAASPAVQDEVVSAYAERSAIAWLDQHETGLSSETVDHGDTAERGLVLFFTGLSGSGKSTVARAVREAIIEEDGRPISFLDGDVVRRHLSAGLTFSPEDRETNIRRIGWVAAEIAYHGGLAICSPIAPYSSTRQAVRSMTADRGGDFVLIHVSTPVSECERRDRKGLYAKARAGQIEDFTGVNAPYESPDDADLTIDTSQLSVEGSRDAVLALLRERGHLVSEEPEWVI